MILQCKEKDGKVILEIRESNTELLIFAFIARCLQVLKTLVQQTSFSLPSFPSFLLLTIIY